MLFSLTAILASTASLAAAYTTPVGDPSGNPIDKPGLGESVPVGMPYTISWTPTTSGTVTILLLRGPSTNVVPIATLVEGLANSGTYSWTPSTSLDDDVTHYGIELIVDATGQYQYSTQFGISNPNGPPSDSSNSTASNSTTSASTSTVVVMSTGYSVANSSIIAPTVPLTVPTTLLSTPTAQSTPTASVSTPASKGAAGQVVASLSSLFLAVAAAFSLAF